MIVIDRMIHIGKPDGRSDYQVLWPAHVALGSDMARRALSWLQFHGESGNDKIAVLQSHAGGTGLLLAEFDRHVDQAGRRISTVRGGHIAGALAPETASRLLLWWYRHGGERWTSNQPMAVGDTDLQDFGDLPDRAQLLSDVVAVGLGLAPAVRTTCTSGAAEAMRLLLRFEAHPFLALISQTSALALPAQGGVVLTETPRSTSAPANDLLRAGLDPVSFDFAGLRQASAQPQRRCALATAGLRGSLDGLAVPLSVEDIAWLSGWPTLRRAVLAAADADQIARLAVDRLSLDDLRLLRPEQRLSINTAHAAALFIGQTDALAQFTGMFGPGVAGCERLLSPAAASEWRAVGLPGGRINRDVACGPIFDDWNVAGLLATAPLGVLARVQAARMDRPVGQFHRRLADLLTPALVEALTDGPAVVSPPAAPVPTDIGHEWFAGIDPARLAQSGAVLAGDPHWGPWWRTAMQERMRLGGSLDAAVTEQAFWRGWTHPVSSLALDQLRHGVTSQRAIQVLTDLDNALGLHAVANRPNIELFGLALGVRTLAWHMARSADWPDTTTLDAMLAGLSADLPISTALRALSREQPVDLTTLAVPELEALLPSLAPYAVAHDIMARSGIEPGEDALLADLRTLTPPDAPPRPPEPAACRRRPNWAAFLFDRSGWRPVADALQDAQHSSAGTEPST